jgi:hypothetical protein
VRWCDERLIATEIRSSAPSPPCSIPIFAWAARHAAAV